MTNRKRRLGTALVLAGMFFMAASPASNRFQMPGNHGASGNDIPRVLDSNGDVGEYTSIAIGANGFPIISYYDNTEANLKAFACADSACVTGSAHVLDTDFATGRYTSIAIRANGFPIISYQDVTFSSLRAYDCSSVDCSTGSVRQLDGMSVGAYSSIAIRQDGRPIISYFDNANWNLKIFDCGDTLCSIGTARTLTTGEGLVGTDSSIAIRLDGMPVVSYRDVSNMALKLYTCTATDCSSGASRELDTIGDVGRYSSVAIRHDGRPLVSYFNDTSKALMAYSCSDVACSGGNRRVLDDSSSAGWYTSIAIGMDGLPIISHFNNTAIDPSLRVFVCANLECTSGLSRELDNDGIVGEFTGIAIRNDGLPIISYHDILRGDLRVFGCADATCFRDRIFDDGFDFPN